MYVCLYVCIYCGIYINAGPSSLTASLEAGGLGLLLRPYVQYSDGLTWAIPGLDFLSEDYLLLNQLDNNTVIYNENK